MTLQTPFLYQNRQTGLSSTTPLTARQFCRILCPIAGAGATPSTSSSIITPQTRLLGYDLSTHSYDPAGWRYASSIPILREACAFWYYETKDGVKGPVSTRVLADILHDENSKNGIDENDNGGKIDMSARVFQSHRCSSSDDRNIHAEWTRIQDLQDLRLAMEAVTEVTPMPTSWPATDNTDIQSAQVSIMTYENDEENGNSSLEAADDGLMHKKIQDDLETFLLSTDHLATHAAQAANESDEEYESDGGTKYVRDSRTGNWIHEALALKREKTKDKESNRSSSAASASAVPILSSKVEIDKKRKKNKAKFASKNARHWIYVTGLPHNTNEDEVAAYFSKVGIIELDPETQKPKVKLYRHKDNLAVGNGNCTTINSGALKGDASICYARPESVELALQVLDENLFRDGAILSVQRAKFEQHGAVLFNDNDKTGGGGRRMVSEAKRKVARLAALQAVGWDEGENGRIAGGLKGLRIVVLMNIFDPMELKHDTNDEKLQALENMVRAECEEIGLVEKITVFSNHPAGVMIVKFTLPTAASEAVMNLNGKILLNGRKVEASYWDGVTDYTCRDAVKDEKETEKRLDEFGDWLENQELPEEFELKVEE